MTDDLKQWQYWEKEHGHREFDHPVVDFFAFQLMRFLFDILNVEEITTALDVGCGNGFSTFQMKKYLSNVFATDFSKFMLRRHPFHKKGVLALSNAAELPFRENQFALVYGWEVLHHISDPGTVVSEMARCSRRYVIVFEPNPINPAQFAFALMDPEHRWVLRYSRKYMQEIFRSAGLKTLAIGEGGWIFPNVTPLWLLSILAKLPYPGTFGISKWIIGVKE